jgi:hypothetical protein
MSAGTRPPLLQLGGQEAFAAYEKEFSRLYQNRRLYDVLGNQVVFEASSCWHVCFEPQEKDQYSRRKRTLWSQERAEHIPWIMDALNDLGTEVRPNDKDPINRLNYLIVIEADPANNLPQEYYIVVTERINRTTVRFTTAYPIDVYAWRAYRKTGLALYPMKKKKDKQ